MSQDPNEAARAANKRIARAAGCLSWLYGAEMFVYVIFVGIPALLLCICCGWGFVDVFIIK